MALVGLLLAASILVLGAAPAASMAACSNPVQCENQLTGADPSTWEIDGAGDPSLQGFATQMSVNKGEAVSFKISSATSAYHIDILRLGYYAGKGARLIQGGLTPTSTTSQPACQKFSDTGLIDCGNWSVSRTWTVPSTAVSGVYLAHLVPNAGGQGSHITFVVRDDASHSAISLQTSDATWQAYNTYGGNSLYQCTVSCPEGDPAAYKAAYKVSYNRPLHVAEDDNGRTALFSGAEYPMIRFLERNGYDMSYTTDVDTASRGSLMLNHKTFISSGHDEYWSASQRNNVKAARDAGVNLAFFSGNEAFWKTRWEPSAAGTTTANRTLVAYKDTHFQTPQDPVEWTGTWRDPRFVTADPENALTGQTFLVNSGSAAITVPYAMRTLRMWRNTDATSLGFNQSLTLAPQTLGYEWDQDADNGFRPAGSVKLSSTTVSGLELFVDYGIATEFGGTATHNMTLYKVPSGARVFGAGTVQWSWGLDALNFAENPEDKNMQQATVNLLADMGGQPTSLISGLSSAAATTDTTAPVATISSPPSTVTDGSTVTLSGTATDVGGVVAGIEISTDGGTTWHPATSGTSSWTYSWRAHGAPSTVIKVRATDDSGNTQTPGAGSTVNVTCPCSIWGSTFAPPTADVDSGDPDSVELGVKFKSDVFGSITGIRFYKSAANTGTHSGSLWSDTGQRLAQVTFTGESASGWQTATFSSPVQVTPGQTYVASYYAPNGHYANTPDYMYNNPAPGPNGGGTVDGPPLHVIRNSGTTINGVFAYGSSSSFPVGSYRASNYWVDVTFAPISAPGTVTGATAVAGGKTSANVSWTAPSTGGAPTSYKITPYIGTTAQAATTITGTPPATSKTVTGLTTGQTYTFTVQAINPTGPGTASAKSNAVTPLTAVAPSVPTDVDAEPATGSARVTWTVPAADGDSAITGYTITPYVGATAQTATTVDASTTAKTITGLSDGTSYTFKVVATNGVGNSAASAASAAIVPRATIFEFASPSLVDSGDSSSAELGVKFKSDSSGSITGIRFYKAAANAGTHIGSLWSATGTRLAQATFTTESASGWQHVTFASPVTVTAGTTYVASYFAPQGHYSATGGGLSNAFDNVPLHALSNATSANGVYSYSAASTFPTSTYEAGNYFVDVLFAVAAPGQVTGVTAAAASATSVDLTWNAPATGGTPTSYKITPYIGATAQATTTVTGTPPATSKTITGLTSGQTYTFTVQAINGTGSGTASSASNAVTPQASGPPSAPSAVAGKPATKSALVTWTAPSNQGGSAISSYTVTPYIGATAQTATTVAAPATSKTITGLTNGADYTFKVTATNADGTGPASGASATVTPDITVFDFAEPGTIDGGDTNGVELGVKFRTDFAGSATGVRFYKAATNTGTHVGSVWTTAGVRLAQATFTNETASGWQHVKFASPVALTAGTTYIASYHAPNGHYSVGNSFSAAVDNAPLHALADATSPNGVFAYSGASTFPASSFAASNYVVDVLFDPAPAPGKVTGVTATAGEAAATVTWTAPATGGPPSSYEITPFIGATAQPSTTVSAPATSKTVTGLTLGQAYTFKVQASNMTGAGTISDASNAVTPLGVTVPGAPTGASAEADSTSAIVRWTAPANDGGATITGYAITPYVGSTAGTPTTVGASSTKARVASLDNGTAYTFKVAAINGQGIGAASGATGAVTPKASIFGLVTPPTPDAGDNGSVVLGVKFSSDVAGTATGVRFYKSAANTGTHVGAVWSATGDLLGQVTFGDELGSGWQVGTFSSPVSITANTTYVVSYLAPNGHYSVDGGAFSSVFDNTPLHALDDHVSSNGVFVYSGGITFPYSSYNATNYFVDVLFSPAGT
jgi:hypothetical protein